MSRSRHSGHTDQWLLIRLRSAVHSVRRGERGRAFLKEVLGALDAMPDKRLNKYELRRECESGTIGSVEPGRDTYMSDLDPDSTFAQKIAQRFGIADALVREIEYISDEHYFPGFTPLAPPDETPEARWIRVRAWVAQWTEG